jgi:hypothetical protein
VDAVLAFLLLGVIWAAVLVPPWLQHRREVRPNASMVNFRRQLWSLARTSPGHGPDVLYGDSYGDDLDDLGHPHDDADVVAFRGTKASAVSLSPAPQRPRAGAGAYRRRRRILGGLIVLAAGAVVPTVVLGGAWWIGQAVTGGLLATYLCLLVRRHRRLSEQAHKVRYLTPIRAPRPAVVVLDTRARVAR